jgi:hypothetical protein
VACDSSGTGPVSGCAARELPCPRGDHSDHYVSTLVAGGRTLAGHPSGASDRRGHRHVTAASVATCAGHSPSGRWSFRKQRTVNPLIVPARYDYLYFSSRPALRPAATPRSPGNRPHPLPAMVRTSRRPATPHPPRRASRSRRIVVALPPGRVDVLLISVPARGTLVMEPLLRGPTTRTPQPRPHPSKGHRQHRTPAGGQRPAQPLPSTSLAGRPTTPVLSRTGGLAACRTAWPLANEAGGRRERASPSGSACDHRRHAGASGQHRSLSVCIAAAHRADSTGRRRSGGASYGAARRPSICTWGGHRLRSAASHLPRLDLGGALGHVWGMKQGTARDSSGAGGQLCSGLDQRRRLGAAAFVSACRLWHASAHVGSDGLCRKFILKVVAGPRGQLPVSARHEMRGPPPRGRLRAAPRHG